MGTRLIILLLSLTTSCTTTSEQPSLKNKKKDEAHIAEILCSIPFNILIGDDPINEMVDYLRENILEKYDNSLLIDRDFDGMIKIITDNGHNLEDCDLIIFLGKWKEMEEEFYEKESDIQE